MRSCRSTTAFAGVRSAETLIVKTVVIRAGHASAVHSSTVEVLSSGYPGVDAGGAASFDAADDFSPLGLPSVPPRTDLLPITQAPSAKAGIEIQFTDPDARRRNR
jgi:hypothetical protein